MTETNIIIPTPTLEEIEAEIDRSIAAREGHMKRKQRKGVLEEITHSLDRENYWTSEEGHIVFRVNYDEKLFAPEAATKFPHPRSLIKEYFGSEHVSDICGVFEDEHIFVIWADNLPHDEEEICSLLEEKQEEEEEEEESLDLLLA